VKRMTPIFAAIHDESAKTGRMVELRLRLKPWRQFAMRTESSAAL